MCKVCRHIFFIALLLTAVTSFAQQDEVTVTDTVRILPYEPPPSAQGRFLPLSQVEPVEEKKIPRETIDALHKDDDYWYANATPEQKKALKIDDNPSANTSWLSSLLWIIILVSFIAVVIWYLASSNINIFRKAPKNIVEEEEEELTEDIFAVNYEKEISRAADAKNYRLAIRLWYLRTLKELADKNRIDYRHEKTNSDYINQLINTNYYLDFFRLTRNFEYTWYGQFPLTEEGYRFMEKDFEGFKNSIR